MVDTALLHKIVSDPRVKKETTGTIKAMRIIQVTGEKFSGDAPIDVIRQAFQLGGINLAAQKKTFNFLDTGFDKVRKPYGTSYAIPHAINDLMFEAIYKASHKPEREKIRSLFAKVSDSARLEAEITCLNAEVGQLKDDNKTLARSAGFLVDKVQRLEDNTSESVEELRADIVRVLQQFQIDLLGVFDESTAVIRRRETAVRKEVEERTANVETSFGLSDQMNEEAVLDTIKKYQ